MGDGDGVGVAVGTGEGVGVGVAVSGGVGVSVGAGVGVAVLDGVGVSVGAGVGVAVSGGVGVSVGAGVGVAVSGGVGVSVGAGVGVAVSDGVGVSVGAGVGVAVSDGVGVSVSAGVSVAVSDGVGAWVGAGVSVAVSDGVGASVGAGVGVSDGGPSLHADRVVAMRTANKPLRMAPRTPVQRLSGIGNISMSRDAVFSQAVSVEWLLSTLPGSTIPPVVGAILPPDRRPSVTGPGGLIPAPDRSVGEVVDRSDSGLVTRMIFLYNSRNGGSILLSRSSRLHSKPRSASSAVHLRHSSEPFTPSSFSQFGWG